MKVILLDCRSYKDVLERDPSGDSKYLQSNGDMLGEAQWTWLREELTASDADVHFLISGTQILQVEQKYEKWNDLPIARTRLFDLIKELQPNNLIMFSGDRHIAELAKIEMAELSYPLYEITASGMTHSYPSNTEPNQYRVGDLIGSKNYGMLKLNWTANAVEVIAEIKGTAGEVYLSELLHNYEIN